MRAVFSNKLETAGESSYQLIKSWQKHYDTDGFSRVGHCHNVKPSDDEDRKTYRSRVVMADSVSTRDRQPGGLSA